MLFMMHGSVSEQWQELRHLPPGRTDPMSAELDLLNDGSGNPKNTKSMLLRISQPLHRRWECEKTRRLRSKGSKMIHYTVPKEEDALAIDAYLRSAPGTSVSDFTERAEFIRKFKCGLSVENAFFTDSNAVRVVSHLPNFLRDVSCNDVGTGTMSERRPMDSPPRCASAGGAPYLHDGRYLNAFELLKDGRHVFQPLER